MNKGAQLSATNLEGKGFGLGCEYGSLSPLEIVNDKDQRVDSNKKNLLVWVNLVAVIALGPINFVTYKIMYNSYESECAFFVVQMVNLLYIIVGGAALAWAMLKGEISGKEEIVPKSKFLVMGLLDSLAGFLAGIGAAHTSGTSQQLFNQSLIPCTMFFSWFLLGHKVTKKQFIGSMLIFCGACIVIAPSFKVFSSSSPSPYPYSSIIYFSSNIPYALSYCYKEWAFKKMSVHVLYLTQFVSIFQFLIGFLLSFLQLFPGFGSETGMSFYQIWASLVKGANCFLQLGPSCKKKYTFFLLIFYVLVNFSFNTLGLFICKNGSATLNAISYAIILPLTTLAFTLPFLGEYTEPFQAQTLCGLFVVLIGFGIWKRDDLFNETTSFATIPDVSETGGCCNNKEESDSIIINKPHIGSQSTDGYHERLIIIGPVL